MFTYAKAGIKLLPFIALFFLSCLNAPVDVPTTGTITGLVTDAANGNGLAGVTISTDPVTQSVTTNASGEYTISNCPAATYAVTATKTGYSSVTKNTTVTGGGTGLASFALALAVGTITGKVTNAASSVAIDGVSLTTTPATQTVTSNANGDYTFTSLNPNSYTVTAVKTGFRDATTTVTAIAGQTVTANLQLTVIAPSLTVTPTVLNFGSTSSVLQMTITNSTSAGILSWTITKPVDASWLALSTAGGQTTTTPSSIVLTVDKTGLTPGNYSTVLTIASNGGNSTVNILMTVINPSAPQVTVSSNILDFDSLKTTAAFNISNSGTGTLTYQLTPDMSWISVSPANGSIVSNTASISVSVNRSGLTAGSSLVGNIVLTSNGGSANISVTMKIGQSGALTAPTLQVSSKTDSSCVLGWTTSSDTRFSNYKVYSSHTSGVSENSTLLSTVTTASSNSYAINGVVGPDTIYYRVYVNPASGAGSASNEVSVVYPAVFRPKNWTLTYANPSNFRLNDINSLNDNTAWAVGDSFQTYLSRSIKGVILKWNGSVWVRDLIPDSIFSIGAVQMLSSVEGYALAFIKTGSSADAFTSSVVLKYNGISWSIFSRRDITSYYGVSTPGIYVQSSNLIFVSIGNVFKVEGNTWTDQGITGGRFAFLNSTCGFTVTSTMRSSIYKYNGFGWTAVYTPDTYIYDLSVGTDSTLACSKYYTDYGNDSLLILKNDQVISAIRCLNASRSIFAFNNANIWIGGSGNSVLPGVVAHYDGIRLTSYTISGASLVRRLWFHNPNSGWGIATNGIYMYR